MSRIRSALLALALLVGWAAVGILASPAAHADAAIESDPLTVWTTDVLNCQVLHSSDTSGAFYPTATTGTAQPGLAACGTFVAVGGPTAAERELYGPANVPAAPLKEDGVAANDPFASGARVRIGYTPVSQTGPTGSGTHDDPYEVITVVDLGDTGLQLTQTDQYVVGQELWSTAITIVAAPDAPATDLIVYRGGDCYLQGSDSGRGQLLAGVAPVCRALEGSANPDRIMSFEPITPGSDHIVDYYATMWSYIANRDAFPNTILQTPTDNAMGLSWQTSVTPDEPVTIEWLNLFSPTGEIPLTLDGAADAPTSLTGDPNGYTVTMANPAPIGQQLDSLSLTLPDGFSYTPGSTTGATNAEPAVDGQTLTWTGPFAVPAATDDGAGELSLHIGVTVGQQPGEFTIDVVGESATTSVADALDVAPIEVLPRRVVVLGATADLPTSPAGGANGYTITMSNAAAIEQQLDALTVTLPQGFSYVPGSAASGVVAGLGEPAVVGQALTWAVPFTLPPAAVGAVTALSLHIEVSVSPIAGVFLLDVTGASESAQVIDALGTAPIEVLAIPVPPVDPGAPTGPTLPATGPAGVPTVGAMGASALLAGAAMLALARSRRMVR